MGQNLQSGEIKNPPSKIKNPDEIELKMKKNEIKNPKLLNRCDIC